VEWRLWGNDRCIAYRNAAGRSIDPVVQCTACTQAPSPCTPRTSCLTITIIISWMEDITPKKLSQAAIYFKQRNRISDRFISALWSYKEWSLKRASRAQHCRPLQYMCRMFSCENIQNASIWSLTTAAPSDSVFRALCTNSLTLLTYFHANSLLNGLAAWSNDKACEVGLHQCRRFIDLPRVFPFCDVFTVATFYFFLLGEKLVASTCLRHWSGHSPSTSLPLPSLISVPYSLAAKCMAPTALPTGRKAACLIARGYGERSSSCSPYPGRTYPPNAFWCIVV